MERTDSGILIAIEGIDGAGKSTQVVRLEHALRAAGERVIRSKEPTDGPWGQQIRQSAATKRMSLDEELKAFIEDRREHLRDKILPALADGMTVILDRYFYSTIAYQGSRGGDVESLMPMMLALAPEPDVVLLLDVPPAVGLHRIEDGRSETPNAFENLANLTAVRKVFLEIATQRENIVVIDATPGVDAVQAQINNALINGVLERKHCAKHWGCADPFNCMYRATDACAWAKLAKRFNAKTVGAAGE